MQITRITALRVSTSSLAIAVLGCLAGVRMWAQMEEANFTGTLEYVSKAAIVIRLADKREIVAQIPDVDSKLRRSIQDIVGSKKFGDVVDVGVERGSAVYDEALNCMLYSKLSRIAFFHNPSEEELASATASPSSKLQGNLLQKSNDGAASSREPVTADDGQLEKEVKAEQPAWSQDIASVKQHLRAYLTQLPSFVAAENTARFRSDESSVNWILIDRVRTDVRFNGRRDIRTNITHNGVRWDGVYDALPGMKWHGPFGGDLRGLFRARNAAAFTFEGDGTVNGHPVLVFSFNTPADSGTRWWAGNQLFFPATTGKIYVSAEDQNILQFDRLSKDFAAEFPFRSIEEHIVWDYVTAGSIKTVLPKEASMLVLQNDGRASRNENVYSNYGFVESSLRLLSVR